MICSVSWTASGTGLQSFSFPFTGTIVGAMVSASQTTPAACSVGGLQVPSSGVLGGDGSLICVFAQNSAVVEALIFPIKQAQAVFVDVKVAATFIFFVER